MKKIIQIGGALLCNNSASGGGLAFLADLTCNLTVSPLSQPSTVISSKHYRDERRENYMK